MTWRITDLCQCPEFFDTVADRIWRAWWKPGGAPLAQVSSGLEAILKGEAIPFAIVAHDGETYCGSALGIASDLDERPQYSPWVAAVWVEPRHRRKEIGRSLARHAAHELFARGFAPVFLYSVAARRNFYTRQGWEPIEQDVGPHLQTVYRMRVPPV